MKKRKLCRQLKMFDVLPRYINNEDKDVGYIYILLSFGYYKIGKASDLKSRISHYKTHNPNFDIIYTIKVKNMKDTEQYLLDKYKNKRKDKNRDWFVFNQKDLQECQKALNACKIL